MITLLIDGDVLIYRIGFACETRCWASETGETYKNKKNIPEGITVSLQQDALESSQALWTLRRSLEHLLSRFETLEYKIFLTHSDPDKNFRASIAKTAPYKGNRTGIKPVHYQFLRDVLIDGYGAKVVEGIEADDALGFEQTRRREDETVICSIDKDLWMIPGMHFDMSTKELTKSEDPGILKIVISKKGKKKLIGYGFKWFCAQMLMGDSVDNIIGLHRVGPMTAFKALDSLQDEKSMWKKVCDMYEKDPKAPGLEENANLLWISRAKAYRFIDYKEKNLNEVSR